MTSYERVHNTLNRKPVDQCPFVVGPWTDADKRWRAEGNIPPDVDIREFFGQDLRWSGALNLVADLDYKPELVEETDETVSTRDGNGAVLRRFKNKQTTPEHVGFRVAERQDWEQWIKPHFGRVDKRRIPFEAYRAEKKLCADKQRFLFWGGCAPFELMHPVCGHENLLMGMALDPDSMEHGPAIRTKGLPPPILTLPILTSFVIGIIVLLPLGQHHLFHSHKIVVRIDAYGIELRLNHFYLITIFEDPQLFEFLRALQRRLRQVPEREEKIFRERIDTYVFVVDRLLLFIGGICPVIRYGVS